MSNQVHVVELACDEVRRALLDYMDGDLPDAVRGQIDEHLRHCDHCTAVYDGVRNVVALVCAHASFELPEGFSGRLYRKLSAQLSKHGRQ